MENVVATVLIAIVVLAFLLVAVVIWKSSRRRGFSAQEMEFVRQQWMRIQNEVMSNPRHAVMDADKLLDHVLKKKGYQGSLGEKMKAAGKLFSDQNGIWGAHKIRNRLAHELDYQVSVAQAKGALAQFRRALRDLGAKL